jgi:hypothetical protein
MPTRRRGATYLAFGVLGGRFTFTYRRVYARRLLPGPVDTELNFEDGRPGAP